MTGNIMVKPTEPRRRCSIRTLGSVLSGLVVGSEGVSPSIHVGVEVILRIPRPFHRFTSDQSRTNLGYESGILMLSITELAKMASDEKKKKTD